MDHWSENNFEKVLQISLNKVSGSNLSRMDMRKRLLIVNVLNSARREFIRKQFNQ